MNGKQTYNRSALTHSVVGERIDYVDLELIAL
jgi:hypothetical protein